MLNREQADLSDRFVVGPPRPWLAASRQGRGDQTWSTVIIRGAPGRMTLTILLPQTRTPVR